MPIPDSPAAAIRARLAELGWTQQQLSEQSRVSVATIRKVMAGTGTPHERTLSALSTALGWPADGLTAVRDFRTHDAPVAPYLRVAKTLRDGITSGAYPPGAKLSSGRVLATEHGVVRQTVERAVETLRHEGLVTSCQGAGVFVADQHEPLQHGTSAETVAAHYRAAIRAGTWTDGQQLPSTRAVADEWGTSVATVSRAFALLADEGLVINRDRSSRVVSYSGAVPTGSLTDLTTPELADLAVRVTTELQRRLGT